MADLHALIDKLIAGESLAVEEYALLVKERTPDTAARLAAAAEEGKEKGIKGLPAQVGIDMAADMVREIKEKKLCSGVHIMAIGAEKNVPVILDKAGIQI